MDRSDRLAWRARQQGLHERQAPESAPAVSRLGLQDTSAGAPLLALAARVEKVAPGALDDHLTVWAQRGAMHSVAEQDVAVITLGVRPLDDQGARHRFGHQVGDAATLAAYERTVDAIRDALADGPLIHGELSGALHDRVPSDLRPYCRGCDVDHIAEALFRWAGSTVVRMSRGPKHTLCQAMEVTGDPSEARLELVRRYLAAYSPSTPRQFAEWSGLSGAEARAAMAAVEPAQPPPRIEEVAGVRLLPPGDPYLAARDRDVLVPDRPRRSALWPALTWPGGLLMDGELAGIWRRKKGKGASIGISVTPWRRFGRAEKSAVEDEAGTVAAALGAPITLAFA